MIVTNLLIAINFAIYFLMAIFTHGRPQDLIVWGANYGPLTLSGEWWRLFTCMFIHFGAFHVIVNMIALRSLGVAVEPMSGPLNYAILYFLSGLGGSLLSVIIHPAVLSAGASGAIFGVFGALIGYILKGRIVTGRPLNRRLVKVLVFNIVLNLGISLLPGIDMSAHVGGFLLGILYGFWLPHASVPRVFRRWWQHPLVVCATTLFFYGAVISTL